MSKFNFVSHQTFPEDEHTKELVYLEMNVPCRVAFVRRAAKAGGMFWSVASVGATLNGKKEYFDSFMQDSNFLEKDIKDFLNNRKFEKPQVTPSIHTYGSVQPQNMDEMTSMALEQSLPF
jgi:hypothetical protein